MPDHDLPRYLTAAQASELRHELEQAIRTVRARALGRGAEERGLDHELGMMLARAAVRRGLDLLAGANATIERLEAVVAELEAQLSKAKIAEASVQSQTPARDLGAGHVPGDCRACESEAIATMAHVDGCRCDACLRVRR